MEGRSVKNDTNVNRIVGELIENQDKQEITNWEIHKELFFENPMEIKKKG